VVVTWKERHAGEARPLPSRERGSGGPEKRIFFPADQTATENSTVWLELAGGRVSLKHCSDLLEDFLETISRMESEYLRAAMEGHDTPAQSSAGPRLAL
jgi:hypothetical protein